MTSPSETIKKSVIISQFCIMHYDDPETLTYRGIINYSFRIQSDGVTKVECVDIPPEYGRWKYYSNFYAFSPMIRPIPISLKLINVDKLAKYPWNIKSIKYAFDPFNIQPTGVYFMCWTQPVPGTVALYLHITPEGGSYPSFNSSPPSDSKDGWIQDKLSPIYVLVDSDRHSSFSNIDINNVTLPKWPKDINGYPIFSFRSSDNRCIPDVNGKSIEKCFLETDEDIKKANKYAGVVSLLERLRIVNKEQKSTGQSIQSFFKKIPQYTITIVVSLFILSLIACIIILSK